MSCDSHVFHMHTPNCLWTSQQRIQKGLVSYNNKNKVSDPQLSKTYVDKAVQTLVTMLRQLSTNKSNSTAHTDFQLGRHGQNTAVRRQTER